MKPLLVFIWLLVLCAPITRGETLEVALTRFLAGETITKNDLAGITDMKWPQPSDGKEHNQGSTYLYQVKRAIISPVELYKWPVHSDLLWEERKQAVTYRELMAIYDKDKTPINAYALVCPAMYVNRFDLLPELIAKISENKHLKAHFDKVYASYWKPQLDPEF